MFINVKSTYLQMCKNINVLITSCLGGRLGDALGIDARDCTEISEAEDFAKFRSFLAISVDEFFKTSQ